MNGIVAWLNTQGHVAWSVLAAVISNQPAPARQVVIYTAALVALMFAVPKIIKLVSK